MSTTTTNQDAYEMDSTDSAIHLDMLALAGAAAVLSAVEGMVLSRVSTDFQNLLSVGET